MATVAVARKSVLSLRREIARIEGRLVETLGEPSPGDAMVLRRGMAGSAVGLLATGAASFDAAVRGGIPEAALTEIHAAETRDAGLSSGFALALAARLAEPRRQESTRPLLWIGTVEIFREAGFPYAPGLTLQFGFMPDSLLFAQAAKLSDALWIAEEAMGLTALSAVILELRGNPPGLDLTATRRLHRRAAAAGRPLFLLRQGAKPQPTAAPLRLVVAPAPAARRATLAGPFAGSLGPPGFSVSIDKGRTAAPGPHLLEWNSDEFAFQEPRPAHPRPLVPLSADGTHLAPAPGAVLAFAAKPPAPAAGREPPGRRRQPGAGSRRAS